jgi:glutamate/tyrosine decarboxylase-like PLP-dependent enzyme
MKQMFVKEQDHALDPENWEEFRKLGYRMIDDIVNGLYSVADEPVWRPIPEEVRAALNEELPVEPTGAHAAYEDFRRYVLPYPRGNNHPRFWGWVNGSGIPSGIMAELLAAAMNPSVGASESAPSLVERQVLVWLKEMLGFPTAVSAVLTSGCSMSNIIALAVARNSTASFDVRRMGMGASPSPMVLYGSSELHSSVIKAVELLGFGSNALRLIPVVADYRIDLDNLEKTINDDRRSGLSPFCVIGNVGTVNTGAIDDLTQLADLCERQNLWLHADGAFGALAWLCAEMRSVLKGLQRVDSLAFDLHKWMYLPYDVGCVFVRDAQAHLNTFSLTPTYLSAIPGRPDCRPSGFPDLGFELTRRFRALKVWMSLKEHGVKRFEQQIRENIAQARYLANKIRTLSNVELAAPVTLNVVCFRYIADRVSPERLDCINQELLVRLQRSGIVMPSNTMVGGRFAIRVAITNHRSRYNDFELLLQEVVRIGDEILGEG